MSDTAEQICEELHDAYEQAAVLAGWKTQEKSRTEWKFVPEENKQTMLAAVGVVVMPRLAAAQARIAELEKELAASREDAERMRPVFDAALNWTGAEPSTSVLDRAIDAARRKDADK